MAVPGIITVTSLTGSEMVRLSTTGSVPVQASVSLIAGTTGSGVATTVLTGSETLNIASGATPETATINTVQGSIASFTTSAQSNSTSVTLSTVFTALTYTQTSTGNTVHLKAAPVDKEVQGFSVTNIVTNLTVSAAVNTVSGGAIGTTVVGNTFWWVYDLASTTWYRFNGR